MIGRVIKPSFLMDSSGAIQLYPPPAVLPTGKRNHSFFKSLDSHIGAIKFFLCHHNLKSKTAKKKTCKKNFLCRSCGKQFQREYRYAGCKPENKVLALKLLVRNSCIRDIEAVLGVHQQTVLKWLNQKVDECQFMARSFRNTYRKINFSYS